MKLSSREFQTKEKERLDHSKSVDVLRMNSTVSIETTGKRKRGHLGSGRVALTGPDLFNKHNMGDIPIPPEV